MTDTKVIVMENHTFVICAYRKSPYLEDCIKSLKKQKSESIIKLATSTPSEFLQRICARYNIEYCVREGVPGIASDWNYAYSLAETDYVTIAHQDDIYLPEYGRQVTRRFEEDDKSEPLIVFTDYSELKNGRESKGGINLYIKRMLLAPIRNRNNNYRRWRKRFVIRFGNSICCPSVTYNKRMIDRILKEEDRDVLFNEHFRSNLDWECWEWLSCKEGGFSFIPIILMSHRIHEDSETSATIKDNERGVEDYEMFVRFWPRWVAKTITKVYGQSEKGNTIQ